jgi:hypothetical protein
MAIKRKKIGRILLLLAVIGIGAALYVWKYVYNKPHKNVADAKAIRLEAPALYAAFVKDSAAAGKQYTAQVLAIGGEVVKSDLDQEGKVFVHLKAAEDGSTINCSLEEKAVVFKPGDQLVLKGVCGGYNPGDTDMGLPGDVVVNRCYVVKE